jgi:hypothetical protein
LIEGPYLILYETHPDTDQGKLDAVEIVRIVDGRRNLNNLTVVAAFLFPCSLVPCPFHIVLT